MTDERTSPGIDPPRVGTGLPRIAARQSLQSWFEVGLLLALPIILLQINTNWTFTFEPIIDPYIYTGYFVHLQSTFDTFGPLYYSTRLPWLITGNAAYSLLPSVEAANLALRLLLFYSAAASMYALVNSLWKNRTVATVAAILLTLHAYFLYAIKWDYHNGPGIVLILATLALLAMARDARRWQLLLFGAGFTFACAFSIHVFQTFFAPAYLVWFIGTQGFAAGLSDKEKLFDTLFERAGCVLAGALSCFLLFALVNVYLGGKFLYLEPQISLASSVDTSPWNTGYFWLKYAGWLVLPVVTSALAIAYLAVVIRDYRQTHLLTEASFLGVLSTSVFLIVMATMTVLQLTKGVTLQYYFYAAYLVPFCMLALTACIARAVLAWRPSVPWRYSLVVFAMVVTLMPFIWPSIDVIPGCSATQRSTLLLPCYIDNYMTTGYLLLAGATVVGLILTKKPAVLFLVLAAMSTINLATSLQPLLFYNASVYHSRFQMVFNIDKALERQGDVRFWLNYAEPMGATYAGVASMHLWQYRLISENFPSLDGANGQVTPAIGQPIAILTQRADAVEAATKALAPVGLKPIVVEESNVTRGADTVRLIVVKPEPFGIELEFGADDIETLAGKVSFGPSKEVIVDTPPIPYGYGASLPKPLTLSGYGSKSAIFRVNVKVESGTAGLAAISKDGKRVLTQQLINSGSDPSDVFLNIANMADFGNIVVRSWSQSASARVVILGYSAFVQGEETAPEIVRTEIPLAAFESKTGELSSAPDGVHIVTAPMSWAYAAKLSLDDIVDPQLTGPAVIEVQLQVDSGVVGIGVENLKGTDFLTQQPISAAPGLQKAYLHVSDLDQGGSIVVRTWEKPEQATAHIVSATLVTIAPSK